MLPDASQYISKSEVDLSTLQWTAVQSANWVDLRITLDHRTTAAKIFHAPLLNYYCDGTTWNVPYGMSPSSVIVRR